MIYRASPRVLYTQGAQYFAYPQSKNLFKACAKVQVDMHVSGFDCAISLVMTSFSAQRIKMYLVPFPPRTPRTTHCCILGRLCSNLSIILSVTFSSPVSRCTSSKSLSRACSRVCAQPCAVTDAKRIGKRIIFLWVSQSNRLYSIECP